MAKFIKSLFTPEKRLSTFEEGDEEDPPALDVKRKLSMSRSGRLKQSYKKRQQLSIAVYGAVEDLHEPDRPKSMEYHVNKPPTPTVSTKLDKLPNDRKPNSQTDKRDSKSPEEEIDNAFENIDKS